MVSQWPRVTYEKLLYECQRHECNIDFISRVPDGTSVITFISTSVSCELVLHYSYYFKSTFVCLDG